MYKNIYEPETRAVRQYNWLLDLNNNTILF